MYSLISQGNNLLLKISLDALDASAALDCGQSFRFRLEEDGSFFGVALGRILRLRQVPDGILFYDMSEEEFHSSWADYFDLKTDYEALKEAYRADEVLQRAVAYAGGIRVLCQEPFETLISFLISQNNNIPRIKNSVEQLCRRLGTPLSEEYYAFPTPEQMASASLDTYAGLGLGYRDSYLVDCVQRIADGRLRMDEISRMELEKARETLRTVKGVGPKVAECVLLFGFHRLEAFPVDTWVKKALSRYYPQGFPEQYGASAGVAQQFLFHYIRTCKDAV